MKLEQSGSREWKVTTTLGIPFTFGPSLNNEDIFVVSSSDITLHLHFNTYIGNVFHQLGKVYEQIQLGSYPHTDADYNFKRLREGIESVLRAVGIQCHVQEYGDEEEDFKPYQYAACFPNGEFTFRQDLYENGYHRFELVKYGDRKSVLIKRTHVNSMGNVAEERTIHQHSRTPIGCITITDTITAFN